MRERELDETNRNLTRPIDDEQFSVPYTVFSAVDAKQTYDVTGIDSSCQVARVALYARPSVHSYARPPNAG